MSIYTVHDLTVQELADKVPGRCPTHGSTTSFQFRAPYTRVITDYFPSPHGVNFDRHKGTEIDSEPCDPADPSDCPCNDTQGG